MQENAEGGVVEGERGRVGDLDGDALGPRPGLDDGDGLWVTILVDQESKIAALAGHGHGHVHRFRGGGAFIEQGGIGAGEAGQVGNDRLEVEERLHAALGDLCLIGGVGRVPPRVLQDVAENDGRGDGIGVTHPDVAAEHLVLGGQRTHAC